ncbi:hypothetical protein LCGC14_1150080 [marine sediment metagenome]|uniref:HNH nuclease domain-containing protein n=1 Tax=marine sediment metagenome TaxID=412755 RepID=A0A0F9PDV5_9ZZZZ
MGTFLPSITAGKGATEDDLERFLEKITHSNGCWLWKSAKPGKYGTFSWQHRQWPAHRWIWMVANNRMLNRGLVIDHLCRESRCVNPKHLEAVSYSRNARRATIDARRKQFLEIVKGAPIPKRPKERLVRADLSAPLYQR